MYELLVGYANGSKNLITQLPKNKTPKPHKTAEIQHCAI